MRTDKLRRAGQRGGDSRNEKKPAGAATPADSKTVAKRTNQTLLLLL